VQIKPEASLGHSLFDNAALRWLAHTAAAELQVYVVGGSIRDHLLQRPCADIDLVSVHDPTPLAKALAREFNGHWFWLDQQRGYSRVVLPKPHPCQFDFSPLRAQTLAADLALRDFTINAMAVDLKEFDLKGFDPEHPNPPAASLSAHAPPLPQISIIDPLGGQQDLNNKRLHLCSATVLQDDPLRVLKGLRHCATLGFSLSPETRKAATLAAPALINVAPERIRSEFASMFSATELPTLGYALSELYRCGIDTALSLPPATPEHLQGQIIPALEQGFNALERCAHIPYMAQRIHWPAGDEFSFASLGLFATFLRSASLQRPDPAPPASTCTHAAPALKLSHRGQAWLNWFLHCPAAILPQLEQLPPRRYPRRALLYLTHLKSPLPHALFALAFFCTTEYEVELLAELHQVFALCSKDGRISPLLSGAAIQRKYPQIQGKELGVCLAQLNNAERTGTITSSAEGWEWVKKYAATIRSGI